MNATQKNASFSLAHILQAKMARAKIRGQKSRCMPDASEQKQKKVKLFKNTDLNTANPMIDFILQYVSFITDELEAQDFVACSRLCTTLYPLFSKIISSKKQYFKVQQRVTLDYYYEQGTPIDESDLETLIPEDRIVLALHEDQIGYEIIFHPEKFMFNFHNAEASHRLAMLKPILLKQDPEEIWGDHWEKDEYECVEELIEKYSSSDYAGMAIAALRGKGGYYKTILEIIPLQGKIIEL